MVLRIQKWIPRKRMKFFLPIKKGREIIVNIKRNNLMYTWSHSIDGLLRKKRKQMITLFPIHRTNAIRIALGIEKQATAKIMAA